MFEYQECSEIFKIVKICLTLDLKKRKKEKIRIKIFLKISFILESVKVMNR